MFFHAFYFLFMISGMSEEKQWCVLENCTKKSQQGQYLEDYTYEMFLEESWKWLHKILLFF